MIRLLRGLLAAALLALLGTGVPWGLWHYVGWPLPHHIPTWTEAGTVLRAPMSTTFLLNTLACVLWTVWCAFGIDVVRTARDMISEASWPAVRGSYGSVHVVAALLVGTVMTALVLNRPESAGRSVPLRVTTGLLVRPGSFEVASEVVHCGAGALTDAAPEDTDEALQRPPRTITVRPPEHGIHDSLWRIAVRTMGDGGRWPEIYALNRGRPQPDGDSLTNPDLIRPGWILQVPAHTPPTGPSAPGPAAPPSTTPSTSHQPNPSPPTGTDSNAPRQPGHEGHRGPPLDLPTGGYVGLGLAALIAAAATAARLRRRARYQGGRGERDELEIAPVVRALRTAHGGEVRETVEPSVTTDTGTAPTRPSPDEGPRARTRHREESLPPITGTVAGVHECQSLAWDVARSRGLGLVGSGAMDAIRALLVAGTPERNQTTAGRLEILVPAGDAARLFAENVAARAYPSGLRIVEDLDATLSVLEAELLSRARGALDEDTHPTPGKTKEVDLLLIASPAADSDGRLQALLDNGSSFGVAGVLLGQWRPGRTLCVGQNGTVSADSSSDAEGFTGARLFTVPPPDTRALLDLFRVSEPEGPPTPPDETEATEQAANGGTRAVAQPPTAHVLTLVVLGSVQLAYHHPHGEPDKNLAGSLAPKQREILAYLALHRSGARREALTAAIWPDAPSEHPYNSFHATLSQFRRTLRTATHDEVRNIVRHDEGRYTLDHEQVAVDLWQLEDELSDAGAAENDAVRLHALERGTSLYTGDFATDIVAEWCEAPREAVRRDVLDALAALARTLSASDPRRALALLERARALDRYNEAIYRDIARAQARLGLQSDIPRTLGLLRAELAELDEEPSRETIGLCEALHARRSTAGEARGGAEG